MNNARSTDQIAAQHKAFIRKSINTALRTLVSDIQRNGGALQNNERTHNMIQTVVEEVAEDIRKKGMPSAILPSAIVKTRLIPHKKPNTWAVSVEYEWPNEFDVSILSEEDIAA